MVTKSYYTMKSKNQDLPRTLTLTNTAFSPAVLFTVKQYLPESLRVLSGMTKKVMVSMMSTCPFLTTLSMPILLQMTLGGGLPLMVAQSLMGQPALTVSPCFRLASKSISGASVKRKNGTRIS